MEELRSDAKGLAFMNLFAPLVLMVLVFFSMSAFVPLRDGIKVHVGFMSFAELIVYIPYFLMWFNFLESLKNSYEDNETMVTAVKMGKAAMLVKIIAIVVGAVLSVVITKFFITPKYQATSTIYILSKYLHFDRLNILS